MFLKNNSGRNRILDAVITYTSSLNLKSRLVARTSSSAKPKQVNSNPTAAWKYCLDRIYHSKLVYPRSSLFFHFLGLVVHYLVPKKLEFSYRAIKGVFGRNSPPANVYNIENPAEFILLCHYES